MGHGNGVMDIRFGIGFLEPGLIGFQVYKAQLVFRFDMSEQFFVNVVIKQDLKILLAANAVMIVAFGANIFAFVQFRYCTGVFAIRALGPQAFRGIFFSLVDVRMPFLIRLNQLCFA